MWKWKWGSSLAAGGILNMHDLEFLFYLVDCDDCPSPLDSTRFGSAKYEEKKKTKKGHGGNSRDARFRFWVCIA